MIALIEADEKRKIMALMLRALEADSDPLVKSAAFKGTVDLLLKYKIEEFRWKGGAEPGFDGKLYIQKQKLCLQSCMFFNRIKCKLDYF